MRRSLAQAFQRLATPLVCYYLVTLGLPIANGAARDGGEFAKHALVVLILPSLLIVLVRAAYEIGARAGKVTHR
jgi:hypothetical protein